MTSHGSDRYSAVELVNAPHDVMPPPDVVDRWLAAACQDCNPNLILTWLPEPTTHEATGISWHWHAVVVHDATCPAYTQLRREGKTDD